MKVCICGDVFPGIIGGNVGGAANQLGLLVYELNSRGIEIVVVDYSFKSDSHDYNFKHNGVEVYLIHNFKFLTKFTKKINFLFKCFQTLYSVKADCYISSVRGYQQILPLLSSKFNGSKYYYWVAADLDTEDIWSRFRFHYRYDLNISKIFEYFAIELFFPIVMKGSDLILAQHETQFASLIRKNIRTSVLKNIVIPQTSVEELTSPRKYCVYVGSLDRRKGLEALKFIVEKNSDIQFVVLGKARDPKSDKMVSEIRELENVIVLGHLVNKDVFKYLHSAVALINTSPREGFPITFLEAWSCGTPVISICVDPGEVIKTKELGIVLNGNLDEFRNAFFNLKDIKHRSHMIKYVLEYHNPDTAVTELLTRIERKY